MCGIFAILGNMNGGLRISRALCDRGPDGFRCEEFFGRAFLGFTRLHITGDDRGGMQPFHRRMGNGQAVLLCNGEFYGHEMTKQGKETSDCAAILDVFEAANGSIEDTLAMLMCNGSEYALLLLYKADDDDKVHVYAARDQWGTRPLFISANSEPLLYFASEMKAFTHVEMQQLEPGTIYECIIDGKGRRSDTRTSRINYDVVRSHMSNGMNLAEQLAAAVQRRLHCTTGKIGCLLSGGLDSSLVAALAAKALRSKGGECGNLYTYTIGLTADAPDVLFAEQVASHIGSIHKTFIVTKEYALSRLQEVIIAIESWDTTTVRASTMQYILAERVAEDGCKCILTGDGADEVFCGYKYFANAPSSCIAREERDRLLSEIHLFDGLRADRTLAAHGIEANFPFLDVNFVDFVKTRIPDNVLWQRGRIEKWVLRDAFVGSGLLPEIVIMRKKEAFSDGVSVSEDSWYAICGKEAAARWQWINAHAAPKDIEVPLWAVGLAKTEEQAYYLYVYTQVYGSMHIPHYWLPKWCGDTFEPSARTIEVVADD